MSLMIKQNEVRTRAQIDLGPRAIPTRTWHPVPFAQALDIVEESLYDRGLEISKTTYGVARKDTQLFAAWEVEGRNTEHALTFALRGSLNKSLSWSLIGGLTVRACSNLDLWSGTYQVCRKNTLNVQRDLVTMTASVIMQAIPEYQHKADELAEWKNYPVSLDAGYGFLGKAYGHGVINTRQLGAATDSWRKSDVEGHRERNAYCLYAGLTEGLKVGPLGEAVDRYSRARDYFSGMVGGL